MTWNLLLGLQRVCGQEEELCVDPAVLECMLESLTRQDFLRGNTQL